MLVTVVSGLTSCVLFKNIVFPYFLDITRLHFYSGFSGLSLRFHMTHKAFTQDYDGKLVQVEIVQLPWQSIVFGSYVSGGALSPSSCPCSPLFLTLLCNNHKSSFSL